MKHVFFRLLPPRANFVQTMTAAEAELMDRHAAYWKDLMDAGQVVAYGLGLVADPQSFYGVGILQLADDTNADALVRNDPTIKAHVGFHFEIFPMPRAVLRT